MIKLDTLIPNKHNPRDITPDELANLKDSINGFEKMMAAKPIVIDENNMILAGHQRVKALIALDYKSIPNKWVKQIKDFTETEKKEFMIRDNIENGHWTWDSFEDDYWKDEPFEEWLGQDLPESLKDQQEAHEDDYEIPDEIKTDIVKGDLFEFKKGDLCHRLLCGDSTSNDNVDVLLDGQRLNILFTSPPYNAGNNVLGGNKNKVESKYESYNDNKCQSEWLSLNCSVLDNWMYRVDNIFYNVQQLSGNKISFISLLYQYKSNFVDEIFWFKGHGQPAAAKNVLNSRVEHILIFDGSENPSRAIRSGSFHGNISNLYEGAGNSSNKFSQYHAATFPIHLPNFIISNFAQTNVADCFLGTGTTMVAAHQLNRNCYGMEIDEKYCQVIVDRMLTLDPDIQLFRNGTDVTEKYVERLKND